MRYYYYISFVRRFCADGVASMTFDAFEVQPSSSDEFIYYYSITEKIYTLISLFSYAEQKLFFRQKITKYRVAFSLIFGFDANLLIISNSVCVCASVWSQKIRHSFAVDFFSISYRGEIFCAKETTSQTSAQKKNSQYILFSSSFLFLLLFCPHEVDAVIVICVHHQYRREQKTQSKVILFYAFIHLFVNSLNYVLVWDLFVS